MANELFDEKKLREEIVKKWGAFGAHHEVYKAILVKSRTLDLLVAGGFVDKTKLKEAEDIALINSHNG